MFDISNKIAIFAPDIKHIKKEQPIDILGCSDSVWVRFEYITIRNLSVYL